MRVITSTKSLTTLFGKLEQILHKIPDDLDEVELIPSTGTTVEDLFFVPEFLVYSEIPTVFIDAVEDLECISHINELLNLINTYPDRNILKFEQAEEFVLIMAVDVSDLTRMCRDGLRKLRSALSMFPCPQKSWSPFNKAVGKFLEDTK